MGWDYIIWVDGLDIPNRFLNHFWFGTREMEPSYDCMNFLDAGYLLGVFYSIDNASMAASCEHNQSFPFGI